MARNSVVYIYPNILAEMNRNGDNLKTLSEALGMNYQALSARMRGLKSFELPEIAILMKRYKRSFEYLFYSTNVAENHEAKTGWRGGDGDGWENYSASNINIIPYL